MKIRLISGDKYLQELCREILRRFPDRRWDFRRVESPEDAVGADLTLWDYRPDTNLVPKKFDYEEQLRNIFLVDPQHVISLTKQLPPAAVMVALKPLNPDLLSAMLAQAAARVDCKAVAGESVQLRHERDEILQLLLHSNLKLQEYDQERTRFLARSVHDFRPPLLAVQGYCGLMLDLQLGPVNPRQAMVLRRMQQSVKRLSRLAAGMLQMSVGDHPRTAPPMDPGDIDACIAQAVFEAGPAAEAKQIQIRVKAIPPTGILRFDASQMEQALINLLDNACRFTPKKGLIEVRAKPVFWDRRAPNVLEDPPGADRRVTATREPNAYRIEVRDCGPGFSAEDREHIFEERVSGSRNDDGSRAGLGLAICRRIAASHGGIVFAESNGRGATFVFQLPYATREVKAAPARELRLHSVAG